jgi:hypothetical protein
LLKQLQECERERRSLKAVRKRHEELRMVHARQAERQAALEKLNEERSGLGTRPQEVVNALTQLQPVV